MRSLSLSPLKFLVLFILIFCILMMFLYPNMWRNGKINKYYLKPKEYFNSSYYIINTEACKLPKTSVEIIPSNGLRIPNCTYEDLLFTLDDVSQILTLLPKYQNSDCCLQRIRRKHLNDNSYRLSNCVAFEKSQDVKHEEMLITKCGDKMNFETNLMISPVVQNKLQSWENKPKIERPVSVLFVGIDSTARSLAHRTLPKTLKYMEQIGFIDFKGYYSAGGGTIHNFVAFLLGLRLNVVRKTCVPTWESPFDPCPFIWRNFSEKNYITMYIEDGHQTFNWGGQSGFHHRPTDFYVHPLFVAMEDMRVKHNYKKFKLTFNDEAEEEDTLDRYAYCASSESSPEFLLRYMKRFLTKFVHVPTFSFIFFSNPFHDFGEQILPEYDQKFLDFARFLNSSTEILDETVIVFLSDHGLRETKNLQEIIEMRLPFLFIRIPEKLKNKYPNEDIIQNLIRNSERLTSPYDVHQTLLHILALGQNDATFSTNNFRSNLLTPSSLLVPVNLNRSCVDIFAVSGCVCNMRSDLEPVAPIYIHNMKLFAVMKLNQIVENSSYNGICEKWEWFDLMNTDAFEKTTEYTDNFFQFTVNPGKAQFAAKIRIFNEGARFGECELLGNIQRINLYRNQSWCVRFETDFDKEMKGYCMCKPETN